MPQPQTPPQPHANDPPGDPGGHASHAPPDQEHPFPPELEGLSVDDHLGRCYAQRYGLTTAPARDQFVLALTRQPDLLAAARAKLVELQGIAAARTVDGSGRIGCVLTEHQLSDLTKALAALP